MAATRSGQNDKACGLEHASAAYCQRKAQLKAGYRETFEYAGVGIAHVSPAGRFLEANTRFCEMIGLERADLPKLSFQDITYRDDVDRNNALLERLLRGEIPGYRLEKRYVRTNGELLWADLTVSVVRDKGGKPARLISVVNDITRQKADEERLKYLTGEVSHRTKNMMAIVQALVRQAFSSSTPREEVRDALLTRLAGIAASQEALIHDHDRTSDLHELVNLQLAIFLSRGDPRLEISGPRIELGSAATRAIGMAMHELATNACKYGALSTPVGRVSIAWSVEAGTFRMSWTERGGPPVIPPVRRGFGRGIVENLVATSTGGTVDLAFRADGIVWSLTAPTVTLCI